MADRARTIADRAAVVCLERLGPASAAGEREIATLRRLAAGFAAPLLALPLALSLAYGAALGLPLGVTLVVAVFLIASVTVLSFQQARGTAADQQADAGTGETERAAFDFCPGLMLTLDALGVVEATGGRDRIHYNGFFREPLRRPFIEQVHVTDRIAFARALDSLRQGADASAVELRIDRPVTSRDQAQFINVRLDMTARRDDQGALAAVVAQMTDISAELRVRAEAAEMAGEAERANEAKSRFLAAVSHELRTPLNAILGFSDILTGEYFGKLANERQREYVQLIRQSGGHLLSVVNAMLDMSRIESGRYELMLEAFPVAEAVVECENMLGLQAREKGVTLTSRLARGLGEVTADQRALRQMLINLVGNAIKFTDAGGAVTIDASIEAGHLKIVVSDTGIGIDPDKIGLLGQPFVQIHNAYNRGYEGSGLGLSLVKGLIALHGGSFAMTSRPGEGTVVTISVPADGSGAVLADDLDDDGNTVEFPPRLKVDLSQGERLTRKETVDDDAKAKIA